jgi:hypothetical protein
MKKNTILWLILLTVNQCLGASHSSHVSQEKRKELFDSYIAALRLQRQSSRKDETKEPRYTPVIPSGTQVTINHGGPIPTRTTIFPDGTCAIALLTEKECRRVGWSYPKDAWINNPSMRKKEWAGRIESVPHLKKSLILWTHQLGWDETACFDRYVDAEVMVRDLVAKQKL